MSTLAPPEGKPIVADDSAYISRVPYLPGLDGMRALAVIAVMVYHANSDWLPGGFLGVEVFFVISGYLITLLLISERERTYRISLRKFWARRARRLLPALFVMMTIVVVWTAVFKTNALGQFRGDVIAGLLYVSNYYQIWVGQGYTAAGDFAPLRHLWSLAVEEQFYLFWPVVMLVLLGRAGTRRVADVSRWLFIAALAITVIVALLFYAGPTGDPSVTPDAYWWIGDRPIGKIDTLYLGTISRLPGIMLGSAFAMVWRPLAIVRGPMRSKGRLFDVLAVLALVFLGWMCWNTYLATPAGADPFLFRGGLFLTSIATLVVIAAITHRGSSVNRRLGGSLLVWIGLRSYGLYLYHWPIYQMIRGIAGNKLTLREFVLATIITVVVAEASFRFIETPIRTGRARTWRRRVRSGSARGPKLILNGAIAVVDGVRTRPRADVVPSAARAERDRPSAQCRRRFHHESARRRRDPGRIHDDHDHDHHDDDRGADHDPRPCGRTGRLDARRFGADGRFDHGASGDGAAHPAAHGPPRRHGGTGDAARRRLLAGGSDPARGAAHGRPDFPWSHSVTRSCWVPPRSCRRAASRSMRW